jgi:hypothetical protein
MADLSIITNQVYNWINESDTDFNLVFGENKLYLVVEWVDGASLFIEDYFGFMNELIADYCSLDEDKSEEWPQVSHNKRKVVWFNKLYGIGSEYHGIADRMLDALESQTADLNKMEKERDI